MNTRIIASLFGSCLLAIFFASGASGQQRTFVSGLGNDANSCNRTDPCRTFTHAISQTNAGGEVVALDSAGYGAFAISKAVSIIAPPGIYAGISGFSGDGIDVNIGSGDTVILRGLTVNGQGGTNGIVFDSAGTLHVESCVVSGFSSGAGIFCNGGRLEVKDSSLRGNSFGAFILGTSTVAVDHVQFEANSNTALVAQDGAKVTVRNSIASNNGAGFSATSTTTAPVDLNIESCVASNNASGIQAQSTSTGIATVRVSNSAVTENSTGLFNSGSPALLLSRGNNTVEGNLANTSGTIGSYTAK